MKLEDRKKAQENKFAQDEETMFKIRARRNKQVGLWAAEEMGKSGDEANAYAHELVTGMYDKERLASKLREDFSKSGKAISDAELAKHVNEFVLAARKHFMEAGDESSSTL